MELLSSQRAMVSWFRVIDVLFCGAVVVSCCRAAILSYCCRVVVTFGASVFQSVVVVSFRFVGLHSGRSKTT